MYKGKIRSVGDSAGYLKKSDIDDLAGTGTGFLGRALIIPREKSRNQAQDDGTKEGRPETGHVKAAHDMRQQHEDDGVDDQEE